MELLFVLGMATLGNLFITDLRKEQGTHVKYLESLHHYISISITSLGQGQFVSYTFIFLLTFIFPHFPSTSGRCGRNPCNYRKIFHTVLPKIWQLFWGEFLGTFILVLTVTCNILGNSQAAALSIACSLSAMIYALGDAWILQRWPTYSREFKATGHDLPRGQEGTAWMELGGDQCSKIIIFKFFRALNPKLSAVFQSHPTEKSTSIPFFFFGTCPFW